MDTSHDATERCRYAATISDVVGAVISEVEGTVGTGVLLLGRVSRLRAAGDAVVAAAWNGTDAELRRELSRFEALTAAIWVVRDGLEPAIGRPL